MFFSCEKEDNIPFVYFYERIYLDLPEYQKVKTPGNYIYLSSEKFGYSGVILYCNSLNEYIAYERNCTYMASEKDAILDVVDSLQLMVCRHCGSKFSLIDGIIMEGPAHYSAKTYNCNLLDNNVLEIYNQ